MNKKDTKGTPQKKCLCVIFPLGQSFCEKLELNLNISMMSATYSMPGANGTEISAVEPASVVG